MQDNFEFFYWGPLVTRFQVDNKVVDELLKRGKKCFEDNRPNLVGHIDKELNFSDEDKTWFMNNTEKHFKEYVSFKENSWTPSNKNKIKNLNLDDLWINYMKKNEYNPPHYHIGDISFVLYLQVPKEIEEDAKNYNFNSPGPGSIEFIYGTNDRYTDFICQHIAFPKVGELYVFPSTLYHAVSPFRSDVERISVAGNITFERK